MIDKLECTCIEAYTTRKMRDPNCCACSCDHNDLVEQLAKANERLNNPQGLQEFICLEQMKDIPLLEIHRVHQKLHEENNQLSERVKELEKQRETNYEEWQAKYQYIKDSMSLTNCYECGTPVHELSPRSRCCMCEYGRAQFNERENEQLRKEQSNG